VDASYRSGGADQGDVASAAMAGSMPAWAPARLTVPTRALGCVPVLAQMRAERAKQPAACKRAPELSLRRLKYTWNCRGTPDTGRTTRLASIGPTGWSGHYGAAELPGWRRNERVAGAIREGRSGRYAQFVLKLLK
jgi:hypothetical protein